MGILRLFVLMICMTAAAVCVGNCDRGFLQSPPVFIDNLYDFPLAAMGTEIPKPGETLPAVGNTHFESRGNARQNGVNVQPNLDVQFTVTRLGALHGYSEDWGAAISIPIQRSVIRGDIGGDPASATDTTLGGIELLGKRVLWRGRANESAVATFGLQLPTGMDNGVFAQSNAATNGYYTGFPRRYPLSWQPSSGTWNGYLALAYSKIQERLSYEALVAGKLYTSGDEDVKIGNIFIAAGTATYGVARYAAISLSGILRVQENDSYPNAPAPGVDQPALAGTTLHGTTLYLDPSIRIRIANKIVVGFGWMYPVITPDNGLVPRLNSFLIVYPSF